MKKNCRTDLLKSRDRVIIYLSATVSQRKIFSGWRRDKEEREESRKEEQARSGQKSDYIINNFSLDFFVIGRNVCSCDRELRFYFSNGKHFSLAEASSQMIRLGFMSSSFD